MLVKINRNCIFCLRSLKKGGCAVSLYISYEGVRTYHSTGITLDDRADWDPELRRVIPVTITRKEALELNTRLSDIMDRLESVFLQFEAQSVVPPLSVLLEEFLKRSGKRMDPERRRRMKRSESVRAGSVRAKDDMGFFDVYALFMDLGRDKYSWTVSTTKKMRTLLGDLKSFRPELTFEDLTEDGLTDFMTFLRRKKVLNTPRRPLDGRARYDYDDLHGLSDNTVIKKLRLLRWFLNFASQRGYCRTLDYKVFRPTLRFVRKPVIFLDRDELKQLAGFEVPEEHRALEVIRDIFLFCCYTGLRYSDVENLRRTDVYGGKIHLVTVKTLDDLCIDLNAPAAAICKKYADKKFSGDKVFPVPTNQVMNREIKELCRLAGICRSIRIVTYRDNQRQEEICQKWELMSSHAGRRTFVVTALSMGIPPDVVMKWTGHSSYQAMRPYIDISENTRKEMINRWDSWLAPDSRPETEVV